MKSIIWLIYNVASIVALSFYIFGWFGIIKGKTLSADQKNMIRKHGISHRTSENGHLGIKKCGIIKGSIFIKAYSNHFKKCTFFFAEGNKSNDSLNFNVSNKSKWEIIITDLTEEQINQLKVRDYDNTIMFPGSFRILKNNHVEWKKLTEIVSATPLSAVLRPNPYNLRLLGSIIISISVIIGFQIVIGII